MVTLEDFIHRPRSYNHLNVSTTDFGSERVNAKNLIHYYELVITKRFGYLQEVVAQEGSVGVTLFRGEK